MHDIGAGYGISRIHVAAANGRADIVSACVAGGCGVDDVDVFGCSPIHHAIDSGDASMVRHLISMGCNVSICDNSKVTPLMKAAASGRCDICAELIFNGASADSVDLEGFTAMSYADEPCSRLIMAASVFEGRKARYIGCDTLRNICDASSLQKETNKRDVIYIVMFDDRIVYIGKTTRGSKRMKEHMEKAFSGIKARDKMGGWLNARDWNNVHVLFFDIAESGYDLRELEARLISEQSPPLNVMGRNWIYSD